MELSQLQQFLEQPAINKAGFALECGISKSYLSRILSGEKPLTPYFEKKIQPIMHKYGFNTYI